jgi:glycosyltransferase involved in cell wall biosynthesis
VFPKVPTRGETGLAQEAIHALEIPAAAERFRADVVHDHTLLGPLVAPGGVIHVTTAHGPASGDLGEYYSRISGRTNLVAISESQRRSMPHARWARTIHNAIDVHSFPYQPDKGDFALYLGRVCPDKGADVAARAARLAGVPLVIAGRVEEEAERRYVEEELSPLLGNGIELVGEADSDDKRELLADARALLLPLRWEEPFGLVMVEALACGTPVIAYRRGAAPEIIEPGVNGALVDDVEQMGDALRDLDVSAQVCRASVERRFHVDRMVDDYEALFSEMTSR